ncbi:MAG TPA: hypothetical protein VKV40_04045 [Ktedonobacteraceae bacterium]|nr:hypothetical protein [Ktedonobacteraceae bacterium]
MQMRFDRARRTIKSHLRMVSLADHAQREMCCARPLKRADVFQVDGSTVSHPGEHLRDTIIFVGDKSIQ